MKKLSFYIVALIFLSAAFMPARAQIVVKTKPLRPRVVVVKPAKPGSNYVWIEGHWVVKNHRYVWKKGRWVKARAHQKWLNGHWKKNRRGWVWVPGRWMKI